eukprot:scaffold14822_cov63-Phaeocystis_antarctica.AAC.3
MLRKNPLEPLEPQQRLRPVGWPTRAQVASPPAEPCVGSTSGGGSSTVMGEMDSSVSASRNDVLVGLTFLSASCSQICCVRMSVFSSRLDKARRIAGLRAMFSSMRRKPFSCEASQEALLSGLMRLTLRPSKDEGGACTSAEVGRDIPSLPRRARGTAPPRNGDAGH